MQDVFNNTLLRILILLKRATYYIVVCAFLMSLCGNGIAQSKITNPVINRYSKVTEISGNTVTGTDISSIFNQTEMPDTVLLIQMTGVSTNGDRKSTRLNSSH